MTRLLVAVFLIAHGLIHLALYRIPPDPKKPAPFDPRHSWMLEAAGVAERPAHTVADTMSTVIAVLFSVAGIAVLVDSTLWMPIAVAAAAAGLLLKAVYFHPWLIFGVLIDAGILWAAAAEWPGSLV